MDTDADARATLERLMARSKAAEAEAAPTALEVGIPPPAERKEDQHRIVERLSRKYGLGGNQSARLKLYRRLAALADQHGEPVLEAISTAVAQAVTASRPGHYFAAAIKRMLIERRLWSTLADGPGEPW